MTSPAHPLSTRSTASVPRWAHAVALVALMVTWLVLQENGIALGHAAETVHELFHDGRHLLGVPCH